MKVGAENNEEKDYQLRSNLMEIKRHKLVLEYAEKTK